MLRNLTKPLTNFAKVKEYIVSKLHIGRMPAEASEKIVEDELIDNLKTMGRHAFRETLVEENKILNLLLKKNKRIPSKLINRFFFPCWLYLRPINRYQPGTFIKKNSERLLIKKHS